MKRASRVRLARRILGRVWRHPANESQRALSVARAFTWQIYKHLWRRTLDVTHDGYVVRCWPDNASSSNIIYFNRLFDYDEMLFLQHFLRPGDAAVDVGGNIGAYSMLCAHLVGPSGAVRVFEPHPVFAGRLRENIGINGFSHVAVSDCAVGKERGTVAFVERDVGSRVATASDHGYPTRVVKITTLDESVPADLQIAVVKIDVEGLEEDVLLGATRLIGAQRVDVWMLEVTDGLLEKRGTSRSALFSRLRSLGLGAFRYSGRRGALLEVDASSCPANVLAIPSGSIAKVEERLSQAKARVATPWTLRTVRWGST